MELYNVLPFKIVTVYGEKYFNSLPDGLIKTKQHICTTKHIAVYVFS